jgi:hypothetical protein
MRLLPDRFLWMPALLLLLLQACGGSDDPEPTPDEGSAPIPGDLCPADLEPADNESCGCETETRSFQRNACDTTCVCSSGFWACTETCQDPVFPTLTWGLLPQAEEAEGNGNGIPNPGEQWAITGSVRIDNATEGEDVTVQLGTTSTRFLLESARVTLEDVGVADTNFRIPFRIAGTATDGTATLTVEAFTDGITVLTREVELTVVVIPTPQLALNGETFTEVTGNGDRFRDGGETWRLTTQLENRGNAIAEGIRVEASASSAALTDIAVGTTPSTLNGSGRTDVTVTFTVADQPEEANPTLQVTALASNAATVGINIPVSVRPPDNLRPVSTTLRQVEAGGNDDDIADDGETWEAVFVLENTGAFAINGLTWSLFNYPTTDPELSPDEDPPYTDFLFELDATVPSLAPGAQATITAITTIEEGFGPLGRVFLRAESSLRPHGPWPFDIELTRTAPDEEIVPIEPVVPE